MPLQLLYITQSVDITVTLLYNIPLPQLATLVVSNVINIKDIKIKIQSIGLTGKSIVEVV